MSHHSRSRSPSSESNVEAIPPTRSPTRSTSPPQRYQINDYYLRRNRSRSRSRGRYNPSTPYRRTEDRHYSRRSRSNWSRSPTPGHSHARDRHWTWRRWNSSERDRRNAKSEGGARESRSNSRGPMYGPSENDGSMETENSFRILKADLRTMKDDTTSCDVTLRAGGREFPCHKVVLRSRSAVFRAMFDHNMTETENKSVEIEDIQGDVLEKLLEYLYTGEVTMTPAVTLELLAASDKYDLRDLRDLCESVAIEQLSNDNLGDVIVFSDMHGAKRLWKCALDFAYQHSRSFLKTAGWETLILTRPDLVTTVVKAVSGLDHQ